MLHLRHANAMQLHFCSGVPRYSSALLMVTVFSTRPFPTCLNPEALSGRSLTVSSVPIPPAEAAVVTASGALWSPTHPTFPLPSLSVNLCRFWWFWACVYVDFLWNGVQVARCISYFFQHSCLSSMSAQWRGSSSPEPLHPVCWTWEAGEKLWHRSAFCIKTSPGWFLVLQPCLFHPLLETCPDPGSVTTKFAPALAWEVHWPDWWLVPAVCCPPGCDGFVRTNTQKPARDTVSTLAGRYRTEAVTLSKGESLLCANCSSSGSSQTWLTGCVSQEPVPVGATDQRRRHREFGCASMCWALPVALVGALLLLAGHLHAEAVTSWRCEDEACALLIPSW